MIKTGLSFSYAVVGDCFSSNLCFDQAQKPIDCDGFGLDPELCSVSQVTESVLRN